MAIVGNVRNREDASEKRKVGSSLFKILSVPQPKFHAKKMLLPGDHPWRCNINTEGNDCSPAASSTQHIETFSFMSGTCRERRFKLTFSAFQRWAVGTSPPRIGRTASVDHRMAACRVGGDAFRWLLHGV
jgi:hypothetical protein